MTKTPSFQTKKIFGYAIVGMCIPLFVFSLVEYLFTACPSVEPIERCYANDVYLKEGRSFYIWYNLSQSSIILNQTLHISFGVSHEEVIDFYVMSNSQYEEWEKGSTAMAILEARATNQKDLLFTPPTEGRYYLVLDNTPYNASKSIHFQSTWVAIVTLVNYSRAFNWLKVSLISLVLMIVGNFLSKNPLGFTLKKLQEFARLKQVKTFRGLENIRAEIDLNLKFFWFSISIFTTITFGVIIYSVARNLKFFQVFPEMFPMGVDIFVRLFLYYYFVFIWLSLFFLFWMWFYCFINDLDLWYFVKIKKLRWNPELRFRTFRNLKKTLPSLEFAGYCIVALILLGAGYFLEKFRFPLFVGGIFTFSVPVSRASFHSFHKSCDELNLKWTNELKRDMPFAINGTVIAILMIPLFISTLRIVFPVVLDVSELFTISSFPGPRFQDYFHEIIHPRTTFFEALSAITSDVVLLGSLLLLLVLIITNYVLPQMDRKLTIESKLKSLVTPAIAALLAFATNEIYLIWITPTYSGREDWSLLISLIVFGASYLAGRAYEEAVK